MPSLLECVVPLFPRSWRHAQRQAPLTAAICAALALLPLSTVQAQEAQTQDASATTLERVSVTGSHIRRIDAETASPVITIDRQRIEDSGQNTLGQLLQQLPAMAGNMPNIALNSGFSHGRALVSLRNLGPERTLVLVNGHRMAGPASSVAAAPGVDVNAIPAAMVERIEVLTDGASSVYGSDAIAGVINIILKDKYDGFAATADYGQSTHGDGNRRTLGVEWGKSWERGGLILGLSQNSMNALYDADRPYARTALQYVNGQPKEIRSGGTRAFLDDGRVLVPNHPLAPGAVGTQDFHPYDLTLDTHNIYDEQYLITPVQRTNASAHASFDFTADVQGYLDMFWTRSQTTSQLGAYGLEMPNAAQNYYNPFGSALTRYLLRSVQANTRVFTSTMYQTNIVAGLRGKFADTSWQWDAAAGTARYKDTLIRHGFSVTSRLDNAVGASFRDSDGTIKCGTPGNVIADCTPINVFNPDDPATIAGIKATQSVVDLVDKSTMKFAEASVNGDLFAMPAGSVQAALGLSLRKDGFAQGTSNPVAAADADGKCDYNDGCIMNQGHDETIKEAYAEVLVPLLKGVTGAQALNLDLGTRYSRYDYWGNTTNSKVALEWRPLDNLLVRATGSQVFRAPSLGNLYGSPFSGVIDDTGDYSDPCNGYTGGGNPAACVNVPRNGSFVNTSAFRVITTGSANAGFAIKPEQGRSYDVGVVYDPGWAEGLSLNVDNWRVSLEDMLNGTSVSEVLQNCYDGQNAYCPLIQRDTAGQLVSVTVPFTINSGKVDIRGDDVGIKYALRDTAWGSFHAGVDATYLSRYTFSGDPHNYVGETWIYGNTPRWRANFNLSWDNGPWHASWNTRLIGRTTVGSAYEDLCINTAADGSCVYFHVGTVTYHDVTLSRKFDRLHSTVSAGVNNLGNRTPPRYYGYSSAANTDASTYDTLGRYFWARIRTEF
ncbi:TonB-dependent receptor domain-containing protein [Xanthomonas albilineans]|uniref:TonB-dependent receptor domain-containing protein n=1 Tax=Xanthomonas albilineans TaxID=29447 RepID=UPI0009BAB69E|nr:TonB-dependent receptor [Xanthomonas albilineans]PPU94481.1 TonB-dependent receptor [Xanthomonas albilineans]